MEKEQSVNELKKKISCFIKQETPKGEKFPIGAGYSLWQKFYLSKQECETFLLNDIFFKFIKNKTGSSHSYSTIVDKITSQHPNLSSIILSSKAKSPLYRFKSHIILTGRYNYDIDCEFIRNQDSEDLKISYLSISASEDAVKFLSDDSERVRLTAYGRIGFLKCAQQMVTDKSARIREAICRHLPYEHPLLNKMINDRSKWVFLIIIQKIDISQIPLLLGSQHLKNEPKIIKILNDRFNSKE